MAPALLILLKIYLGCLLRFGLCAAQIEDAKVFQHSRPFDVAHFQECPPRLEEVSKNILKDRPVSNGGTTCLLLATGGRRQTCVTWVNGSREPPKPHVCREPCNGCSPVALSNGQRFWYSTACRQRCRRPTATLQAVCWCSATTVCCESVQMAPPCRFSCQDCT